MSGGSGIYVSVDLYPSSVVLVRISMLIQIMDYMYLKQTDLHLSIFFTQNCAYDGL